MAADPRIPRDLLVIGLVSFLLRLGAWAVAIWGRLPALYDELGYLSRARGWAELAVRLVESGVWDAGSWQAAYGQGHWPPLHSLLLAPMVAFGEDFLPAARLVTVVVSTATTLLVFWLGALIGGRNVARCAAALHAFYPTFIGFSHLLWAETLSAFLLVGLACATFKADGATGEGNPSPLKWSFLAGSVGGLGALAKANALIFVPVVVLWLCRPASTDRRRPWVRAAAVMLGCGLWVVPWLGVLHHEEGRWMPMSTLGGYNLALGNHPWVPPGYGSSWGDELSKSKMQSRLEEVASRTDSDWRTVAGLLALEEMRQQPGTTARRSVERIRMLWTADVFVARHVLHGAYVELYPTTSDGTYPTALQWAVVLLVAVLALSFWILLTCIGIGIFLGPQSAERTLLVLLAIAGSLAPALTLGFPRLHMPLLVILLPLAGRSLERPRWKSDWASKAKVLAVLGWVLFSVSGAGRLGLYLNPSSLHSPAARVLEPWVGPTLVSDQILLRRKETSRSWQIRLENRQAAFLVIPVSTSGVPEPKALQPEVSWDPGEGWKRLEVVARAGASIRIVIESPSGDPMTFDPVRPGTGSWTDLDAESGSAFRWLGGGPGVLAPTPTDD